jgi:hypothetical protein
MSGGYTYILGIQTGTFYIGVTSNMYLRVMRKIFAQLSLGKTIQSSKTQTWGVEDDYSA